MSNYKKIYLAICLSIITFGIILYGYWYFIDGVFVNVPIKTNTSIVKTDKNTYQIGDPIAVKWNYYKGVDTTSTISVNLVDGIIYMLPNVHSTRPVGQYDSYTVVSEIPKAVPTGEYQLQGIVHFEVNPVKNIDYKVTSNNFYIIGNGDLQKQIDKNTADISDLEEVNKQ